MDQTNKKNQRALRLDPKQQEMKGTPGFPGSHALHRESHARERADTQTSAVNGTRIIQAGRRKSTNKKDGDSVVEMKLRIGQGSRITFDVLLYQSEPAHVTIPANILGSPAASASVHRD
jgi:hypothetical protein